VLYFCAGVKKHHSFLKGQTANSAGVHSVVPPPFFRVVGRKA